MAYCKHCGMDSADPKRCEWCGRSLMPTASAPEPAPPPSRTAVEAMKEAEETRNKVVSDYFVYGGVLIPIRSPEQVMETTVTAEEAWGGTLLDFSVYCLALAFLGSCLIAWHYSLYLLATTAAVFVVGILLAKLKAIPAIDDSWDEFGVSVMLMLVLFVPAFLVYIGYIIYGRRRRNVDHTVVRLMTPYVVALLLLTVVTLLVGSDAVPMGAYWEFRGVEFLSLSAVFIGWTVSGLSQPSSG